jgi:NADH-quinone oxidoreductase subunit I
MVMLCLLLWRCLSLCTYRAYRRKTRSNHIQEGTGCSLHGFQAIAPPSYTQGMSIVKDAAAVAKGMSITLREIFQPTEVENYPDGKGPMRGAKFQERFRGKHQLQRDENGLEKCVACFLCAAACPSNCIYIEAAENTAEKRISSAERYAKVYNIDYNRCIFCGYCVEACPTDAITHGHGFELASLNATNLVMRKEDLLVPTSKLPDMVTSDVDQAKILA